MQVTHAASDAAVRAGAAELQRRVERLLGAAVVGRLVERHAEALVELGRDRGQVVLERQREAAAHRLEPALVVAVLGASPCPRARRRGSAGRCGRRPRPARARPRASSIASPCRRGEAALVGHRQLLDRGLGRAAVGGVGRRRRTRRAANAASRSPLSSCTAASSRCAPRQRELVARGAVERGRARARRAPPRPARRPAASSARSARAPRRGAPRRRSRATARAPGGPAAAASR